MTLHCQSSTCSRQLDVASHLPAAAVIRHQRWQIIDGELLCPRCSFGVDDE